MNRKNIDDKILKDYFKAHDNTLQAIWKYYDGNEAEDFEVDLTEARNVIIDIFTFDLLREDGQYNVQKDIRRAIEDLKGIIPAQDEIDYYDFAKELAKNVWVLINFFEELQQ